MKLGLMFQLKFKFLKGKAIMKKKILTISLIAALVAIVAHGTLAYFTDTEARANVFTAGNVEIALHESNNDDDPTDGSYDYNKNAAGEDVLKDEDYQNWLEGLGTNDLFIPGRLYEKDVWVENLGDNPMYTRLHIGVPANVYDSAKDAADHIIDMTFNADNGTSAWTLYKEDGVTENSYYEEFFGVEYYVMVFTYKDQVAKGTQTPICLSSTQMLIDVDCSHKYTDANGVTYIDYTNKAGDSDVIFKAKDGEIPVLVVAEAGQVYTFENDTAHKALDTQFGVPESTVEYVSPLKYLFDANGNQINVYEDN